MSAREVARVLLVAHPSRRRQLTPWLTVEGEPVGYSLEHYSLEDEVSDVAAGASEWDVIVVDGESFPDERGRLALLRRLDLATPGKELEIGDVFAQRCPRLCASLKDLRQSESRPGSDWVLARSQRAVKLYGLFKVAGL